MPDRLARQLDFLLAARILAEHANACVDVARVTTMSSNSATDGGTWTEYAVTREQLVRRTGHIAEGSTALWAHCERMIEAAVGRGWVREGRT